MGNKLNGNNLRYLFKSCLSQPELEDFCVFYSFTIFLTLKKLFRAVWKQRNLNLNYYFFALIKIYLTIRVFRGNLAPPVLKAFLTILRSLIPHISNKIDPPFILTPQ